MIEIMQVDPTVYLKFFFFLRIFAERVKSVFGSRECHLKCVYDFGPFFVCLLPLRNPNQYLAMLKNMNIGNQCVI